MNEAHELLRRALEHLEWCGKERYNEDLEDEIRTYLANQETAEDEPVAWMLPNGDGYDSNFRDHSTVKSCTGNSWTGWVPLYLHPAKPDRKPMTEEEIMDACREICVDFRWPSSVIDCIRYAEKHHGIGEKDE